ncbi:N-acetyltransferase 6-like isoform X2 [Acanthaster planci]|nr:N-acetyltransferase 6-like isoform X2 [Acanthaster planci]XP_022083070.1 N-acetyltransferase 6-like isoform X2 [Acanthaster planci]
MVDDKREIGSDPSAVIGYCRLAKVISVPSSVLIESVVVPKNLRGQGLGRQLMELAETHAKMQGFTTMYLSTKDKQDFYAHLGYEFCKAVNTLDAQILETCDLWQVDCDSTSLSHVSCSSESECPSRDEHPSAGRRQVSRLDGGCPKAVEDSSDDSCSKPSPDSKTSGSLPMSQSGDGAPCETNLSIPPPPPPPPVRVPETPPMVVYWMKKEVS